MSYIGEVRNTARLSLASVASALALSGLKAVLVVGRALNNRRTLSQLGAFDDRMLQDIGLSRSDLRDAASGPLWEDPTKVLLVRAVERRAGRRAVARENQRLAHDSAPDARPAQAPLTACRD